MRPLFALASVLLPGCLAGLACSPDVKDGAGPLVPVSQPANVTGTVLRDGQPASRLEVDLRDPNDNSELGTADTDVSGNYGFHAPGGNWEVRVKGDHAEDFDSVTRVFTLVDETNTVVLPTLDIGDHGAQLKSPSSGAHVPAPTPAQPLSFQWDMPDRPVLTARVQVYDAADAPVWLSTRSLDPQALWNGLGNQGTYAGRLVSPGSYIWRVKFEFPDTSEARMQSWSLTLE